LSPKLAILLDYALKRFKLANFESVKIQVYSIRILNNFQLTFSCRLFHDPKVFNLRMFKFCCGLSIPT